MHPAFEFQVPSYTTHLPLITSALHLPQNPSHSDAPHNVPTAGMHLSPGVGAGGPSKSHQDDRMASLAGHRMAGALEGCFTLG